MEWYQIITFIISILSFLGFGAVIQMFLKDKHDKRIQNSKEVKELKKKERQDEIKEVITEVVKEELDPLKEEVRVIKEQIEYGKEGTKASLRNDLLNCYYDCSKKGFRTNEDIMNWQAMLSAYYNLGGNSFIVQIDKIFNTIDTEDVYKEKKKKAKKKTQTKKILSE